MCPGLREPQRLETFENISLFYVLFLCVLKISLNKSQDGTVGTEV
jgi:hypothetical protein